MDAATVRASSIRSSPRSSPAAASVSPRCRASSAATTAASTSAARRARDDVRGALSGARSPAPNEVAPLPVHMGEGAVRSSWWTTKPRPVGGPDGARARRVRSRARDGREALSVYRQHADRIDCVLLDLTMPKLSGADTLRELRLIRSDVRVVLSSGFTGRMGRVTGSPAQGFIQKPKPDALVQAIEAALSASPSLAGLIKWSGLRDADHHPASPLKPPLVQPSQNGSKSGPRLRELPAACS